jgi:dolichol-phosphate mannosyltransferase
MKLSIIIPVFNEEKTVQQVLDRVVLVKFKEVAKEIIVVNDGSRDGTALTINKYIESKKPKDFVFINNSKNMGKGFAVKVGMQKATGDYIIIQDADLEYNPEDIKKLLKPVIEKNASVVYGTRLNRLPHLKKEERTGYFLLHYFGNRFLSLVASILYGQWITDMETCYKLFPCYVREKIQLHARGFDLEPELTAKLLKLGFKIHEVPITTTPRGYEEGKKLVAVKDGPRALLALVKYRFID